MPDQNERASAPDVAPGPPPDERVPVAGVGASAGGLEALERFFQAVAPDCGMAFVVILHLDPDRESRVDEILSRYAPFPVIQVTEPVRLEPGRAYVIAPHTQLELDGNLLLPELVSGRNRPRHPIDAFFRSLSDDRGRGAIGVVLSGTGDDGTLGLRRIREKGGITAAQTPDEAAYSSMPENAIATGMVELILPAAEIPARLVQDSEGQGRESLETPEQADPALDRIVAALREETGRDFRGYKRTTFFRRIDRRMLFNRIADIGEYATLVETDGRERRILYKELLISVSRFFRDGDAWTFLAEEVLPELFARKTSDEDVRVWVPGCATGEEAYSVAMLLHEQAAELDVPPPSIQIFATDIDEEALDFARSAAYPGSIEDEVDDERIRRFFTRDQGHHHVGRPLRDSVLFATHDVRSDPPFLRLDLVSCRNLLIYMEAEVQRSVHERLHYGLREGGVLFLGSSESAEAEYFEPISKKHRIFRRRPGPSPVPLARLSRRAGTGSDRGGPLRRRTADTGDIPPETVHGRLLDELGFPSAVVNGQYEIVHMSKGISPYLHQPEGVPTADILKLVAEPVELELRTALYRAFKHREASKHRIRTEVRGQTRTVAVAVHPGPEGSPLESFALVLFEKDPGGDGNDDGDRQKSATDTMVRELEEELRQTKLQLQSTIEEREATIEELQSANEELQSVNEEQQAAREELESRREELQSLNEELATVNQEYRSKIEELDELNADLHNLIRSTDIATVFLSRDLSVRRFTPTTEEIFNLRSQDEGRAFSDLTHKLREIGDLTRECRTVLETGESVEEEAASSNDRWYNVRILPYRSSDGEPDGIVITCYDITSQKRMEEELREARDAAREAERLKGHFVATVSHELRTPLNALLGYVQLMEEEVWGPLTEEQSTYLQRMQVCTRHLDFMIGQILTFSRMEEGKEPVEPESVDAGDLVREVAAILEPQAEEKGLDLAVELDPGDLGMVTDPGKVRQILLNLGSNALKFTEVGRVHLAVRPGSDSVEFEVRDTGVGIAPENLERVFERFWQTDRERHPPAQAGTGLGLAVARRLTELLGGRMEVESEVGEGSVFRALLPRASDQG